MCRPVHLYLLSDPTGHEVTFGSLHAPIMPCRAGCAVEARRPSREQRLPRPPAAAGSLRSLDPFCLPAGNLRPFTMQWNLQCRGLVAARVPAGEGPRRSRRLRMRRRRHPPWRQGAPRRRPLPPRSTPFPSIRQAPLASYIDPSTLKTGCKIERVDAAVGVRG